MHELIRPYKLIVNYNTIPAFTSLDSILSRSVKEREEETYAKKLS